MASFALVPSKGLHKGAEEFIESIGGLSEQGVGEEGVYCSESFRAKLYGSKQPIKFEIDAHCIYIRSSGLGICMYVDTQRSGYST